MMLERGVDALRIRPGSRKGRSMDTIVVGYDGRKPARQAALEAAELAQATGASFHLVQVLVDGPSRLGLTTGGQPAGGK